MKWTLIAFGLLVVIVACKDVDTPSSATKFVPSPRTPANTWVAQAGEEKLINEFLQRYPADRAARYRETLQRSDARLHMNSNDQVGQQMLDAIYKARLETQMAQGPKTHLR
jgi:hypothetical protein